MRFSSLRSATAALSTLAVLGGAVVALQLGSATQSSAAAGYEVVDTSIATGTTGPVVVTTPGDEEIQIALDMRLSGFGTSRDMITWQGNTCRFNVEFLYCTPTNGRLTFNMKIPTGATKGGMVIVQVRPFSGQWADGDKGIVTLV
ncbi:hypothetical protein [Streptomyces sp. NBC_01506]|uniref:hypothetical protein n=1 Tax=Streptomyces sp. NBC_01506 TaxID=2903887 RepID=UPI00386C315A